MVCCQAGSAQAAQQACVHASEGGTEKLLALTVSVSWQRVYSGEVHFKGVAPVISRCRWEKSRLQPVRKPPGSARLPGEWCDLHGHRSRRSAARQTVRSGSVTSVHTSEVGTEKILALTVHVQWERASIGSCPVHLRDQGEAWLQGCCTSDLPMPLGEELNATCTRTTWVS